MKADTPVMAVGQTADTATAEVQHPTERETAALDYLYWEQRGCPDGCPDAHWYQAEQDLAAIRRTK